MGAIQAKWIKILDIGRDLTPISYGLRSPINKPTRYSIEIIRQLLTVSKVTNMREVYEKDRSLEVSLTSSNFREPFEQIWMQQNPNKIFPWATEVEPVDPEPADPTQPTQNFAQTTSVHGSQPASEDPLHTTVDRVTDITKSADTPDGDNANKNRSVISGDVYTDGFGEVKTLGDDEDVAETQAHPIDDFRSQPKDDGEVRVADNSNQTTAEKLAATDVNFTEEVKESNETSETQSTEDATSDSEDKSDSDSKDDVSDDETKSSSEVKDDNTSNTSKSSNNYTNNKKRK